MTFCKLRQYFQTHTRTHTHVRFALKTKLNETTALLLACHIVVVFLFFL